MKRAHLVVAVCAYELVALGTGYVPTITALCHKARRHPVGSAFVAGCCGWLLHHLLVEQEALRG